MSQPVTSRPTSYNYYYVVNALTGKCLFTPDGSSLAVRTCQGEYSEMWVIASNTSGVPFTWFVDCCANKFLACTSYISKLVPTEWTVSGAAYVSAAINGPVASARFGLLTGLASSTDGSQLFMSDWGNQM